MKKTPGPAANAKRKFESRAKKEEWWVALHEAGHAVMYVFLRLDNLERVSIIPNLEADSAGRIQYRRDGGMGEAEFLRKRLLVLCAGAPAMNLAGTRRWLEGTDFTQVHDIADRAGVSVGSYYARASRLIQCPLRTAVVRFAEILFERKEIDRWEAEAMIQDLLSISDPWRLTRSARLLARRQCAPPKISASEP